MRKIDKTKITSKENLKRVVDSNFKKYLKTYQLLDEYDKSPNTAPKFETERRVMQKTLRQVSA